MAIRNSNAIKPFKIIIRESGLRSEVKFRSEDGKEHNFYVRGAGIVIDAMEPSVVTFKINLSEIEVEWQL